MCLEILTVSALSKSLSKFTRKRLCYLLVADVIHCTGEINNNIIMRQSHRAYSLYKNSSQDPERATGPSGLQGGYSIHFSSVVSPYQ